jgi:hypothetical protein
MAEYASSSIDLDAAAGTEANRVNQTAPRARALTAGLDAELTNLLHFIVANRTLDNPPKEPLSIL